VVYSAYIADGDRALYAGRDLTPGTVLTLYGGELRSLLRSERRVIPSITQGGDQGAGAVGGCGSGDEAKDKDTHVRTIPGNDSVALDGLPFAGCLPAQIPEDELEGARFLVGSPLFPQCEDEDLQYVIMHSGAGYMARTVNSQCSSCPRANVFVSELQLGNKGIGVGYDCILALVVGTRGIKKDDEVICKYEAWALNRRYPCTDPSH
jgi:hypothetical protein